MVCGNIHNTFKEKQLPIIAAVSRLIMQTNYQVKKKYIYNKNKNISPPIERKTDAYKM